MNEVSQALIANLLLVYFFYGLAFFTLGVALALASRQESEFHFVEAIRPLSAFGLLHAAHEWVEMFQQFRLRSTGVTPSAAEEWLRLAVLAWSFAMLVYFAVLLLAGPSARRWPVVAVVVGAAALWAGASAAVGRVYGFAAPETLAAADVLARYLLGIPGALLGCWALMVQQRTFRRFDMPQFGQDLVWSATALFLYGAVGQIFVRTSPIPPSGILNSGLFLLWFGVPIQLFRALTALVLTFFMLRALQAFGVENQRRLDAAVQTQLAAQERALTIERQSLQETERLNQELHARARELALLLDLSNLLAAPAGLSSRLEQALRQVVQNLGFADAGMVLLGTPGDAAPAVAAQTGFATQNPLVPGARYAPAWELGRRALQSGRALCRHADGTVIEIDLDAVLVGKECWQHIIPTVTIALPLAAQQDAIGAIVLARAKGVTQPLGLADVRLLSGIAQQMGLSIENARLYQDAQRRERVLGELLYQVVGAQEAERQRIARDLHDATGQSLSAIGLGLRGLENALAEHGLPHSVQLRAIQSFANDAMVELRRIIEDLRPPQLDELGLAPALRWYFRTFQARYPEIALRFEVQDEMARLLPEYETLLFRIVQEALTNIAKHADARNIEVGLDIAPEELMIYISDDGIGFDAEAVMGGRSPGWGLVGIRERTQLLGGELQIRSQPGRGTDVTVRMPVRPSMAQPALTGTQPTEGGEDGKRADSPAAGG
ncbi:MAG: GAF domain-containing sensor histidine kinase [Caldilineaceae bacterium]|nr:GAF domain-containing sensor histidine kinase [Caldilineaceae bacterium]